MHKNADLNLDELGNKLSVHSEPPKRGKKRKNADEPQQDGIDENHRVVNKSFRDEEHYIPYKPKNYNTEKA